MRRILPPRFLRIYVCVAEVFQSAHSIGGRRELIVYRRGAAFGLSKSRRMAREAGYAWRLVPRSVILYYWLIYG